MPADRDQSTSLKSVLRIAIPLLAGLAVGYAFSRVPTTDNAGQASPVSGQKETAPSTASPVSADTPDPAPQASRNRSNSSAAASTPGHAIPEGPLWPVARGGGPLSGWVDSPFSERPVILWEIDLEQTITTEPVSASGIVVVGTEAGMVHAIHMATGQMLWHWQEPGNADTETTPAILGGRVFTGFDNGRIRALDLEEGALQWTFEVGQRIATGINAWTTTSASSEDTELGFIAFGAYDGRMYCLDAATGAPAWTSDTGSYINGVPALSGDGQIVFGGCDAGLYAVDARTGALNWRHMTESYIPGSAALAGNTGIIGTFAESLLLFRIDNLTTSVAEDQVLSPDVPAEGDKTADRIIAELDLGSPVFTAPAVHATLGIVAVGVRKGEVSAFDLETTDRLWRQQLLAPMETAVIICGDALLAGSSDGRLQALKLQTGDILWRFDTGSSITSGPSSAYSRLLAGTEDGRLLCLGYSDTSL